MKKLTHISKLLQAELIGIDRNISTLSDALDSKKADISPIFDVLHLRQMDSIQATSLLTTKKVFEKMSGTELSRRSFLVTDSPYENLITLIYLFYPSQKQFNRVDTTAKILKPVTKGRGIEIGPYAVIGKNTRIGDWSSIKSHVVIGNNVQIGKHVIIYPNVIIYDNTEIHDHVIIHSGSIIGSDGFGYAKTRTDYKKIPHVGKVIIEPHVEIGANCTIDRGTLGNTILGEGTKIDNLVQIAHNVKIGKHTVIAAQSGIAGSSTIGNNVKIGGQVGIAGHLTIGDHVTIGAQSGVIGNIPDGITISGYPAREHLSALRREAYINRIPFILEQLKKK